MNSEMNQEHGSVDLLVPGNMITWLSPDPEQRAMKQRGPVVIDALHADSDRTVWAFVTLPGGCWAAMNAKHVKRID